MSFSKSDANIEEHDEKSVHSKKTEKAEEKEVHSANSWESADLGDDQRNKKFLRLMGASKKEHHGRFIIGDQESSHARQKKEEQHVQEELVDQYVHSLEHRLIGGKRGHLGLGYHPDERKDEENTKVPKDSADVGNVEDGKSVKRVCENEEEKEKVHKKEEHKKEEHKKEEHRKDEHRKEEHRKDEHKKEEHRKDEHRKDEHKREGVHDESDHNTKKMKFVKASS